MEGKELEKEVTEDLFMEFCHHVEQSNRVEAGRESGGSRKDLGNNVHCTQHQALHSLLYNLMDFSFCVYTSFRWIFLSFAGFKKNTRFLTLTFN